MFPLSRTVPTALMKMPLVRKWIRGIATSNLIGNLIQWLQISQLTKQQILFRVQFSK